MTGKFIDNIEEKRFEYQLEDGTVIANYRKDGTTVFINFVEAPPHLRGTGAAGRLMQAIVNNARAENQKLHPVCGYAALWLSRHPETKDVQA